MTKNGVTMWSSNPTPGHISGKDENSNSKKYNHPNIHSNSIYNSQIWKQPKCPLTNEWIKMWYIYIYPPTHTYTMEYCMHAQLLSCVWLFATLWTVVPQAPLSMRFSKQEYFLLQRIFLTQRSNLCLLHLLHWQADSLPLSHLGEHNGILLSVIKIMK